MQEQNLNEQSTFDTSSKEEGLEAIKEIQEVKNIEFEPLEFKANPKEYFKIWIVNIALTLLTLGIYSAWAKVRTNRYLYSSTYLGDSNFEYNADPKRILIGRLIIVGFYGLFFLFTDVLYMAEVAGAIALIFLLLMPWLIRQAIRFKLKVTSYRNIHFKYMGKTKDFYKLVILFIFTFLIYIAVIVFTIQIFNNGFGALLVFILYVGIPFALIPIFYKKYKELVINYSYYGQSKFNFNATNKSVMGLFFTIFLVTFIGGVIIVAIVSIGSGVFASIFKYNEYLTIGISMIIYLSILGLYKGITEGYMLNFVLDHTTLDSAKLKGEIEPITLGFINVKNYILTILTLGLYYPWGRVHYLKHKIENTYFACEDLDKFIAGVKDDTNTIGEEAMDFFDIDIGL